MGSQIICFLLIYSLSKVKTYNPKDIVKYTKLDKYEKSETEDPKTYEGDYLFFIDYNESSVILKEVNKFINHVYISSENLLQEVIINDKTGRMSKTEPKKKFIRHYGKLLNKLIDKDLILLGTNSKPKLNDILSRVIHASETTLRNIIEKDTNYNEHEISKIDKKLIQTRRSLYEDMCTVFNICRKSKVWTDILKGLTIVIQNMTEDKLLEFYKGLYPKCIVKVDFSRVMHEKHIKKLMKRTEALAHRNVEELRKFTSYYTYFFSFNYMTYQPFLNTLNSAKLEGRVEKEYTTLKYDLELYNKEPKKSIDPVFAKLINVIQRDVNAIAKYIAEKIKRHMYVVMWDLEI